MNVTVTEFFNLFCHIRTHLGACTNTRFLGRAEVPDECNLIHDISLANKEADPVQTGFFVNTFEKRKLVMMHGRDDLSV